MEELRNNENNNEEMVTTNEACEQVDFSEQIQDPEIAAEAEVGGMEPSNQEPVFNSFEMKKFEEKQKARRRNKFMPFVATGIASAMVGGMIMAGAFMFAMPKSTSTGSKTASAKEATAMSTTGNSTTSYLTSTNTKDLTIPEIAKKVSPAVVGISATSDAVMDPFGFSTNSGESQGTGIIFSEDGYIVTNYHVVQGAKTIKITLNNGKEVKAKVINYDAANDLAVVKITDKTDIPGIAEFGDSSKLQVGELAVAIGDPLGKQLYGSVTAGVVSALNRSISINGSNHTYIQTDAAINEGNSGGPLVNSKGQVIGINSAKMNGDGLEGLGFAIPINIVKPRIDDLTKPLLTIGISGIEIDSQKSKQYSLPVGIYVEDVTEFSAAQRSGLQAGDVIVKFDGQTVKTVSDLNTIKAKHKVGDSIKINIVRDGANKTLTLKFIAS